MKCLHFVAEYGNATIEILLKLKNNMLSTICMINTLFYPLIFKTDHFKVSKCTTVYYVCGLLQKWYGRKDSFKELGRTTSSIENHISVCTKTFSFILFLTFMTKSKAFFYHSIVKALWWRLPTKLQESLHYSYKFQNIIIGNLLIMLNFMIDINIISKKV